MNFNIRPSRSFSSNSIGHHPQQQKNKNNQLISKNQMVKK